MAVLQKMAIQYLFARTSFEPIQVFNNLYYIGSISVVQFVLSPSEGLIWINFGRDEIDVDHAAESMQKLELDDQQAIG